MISFSSSNIGSCLSPRQVLMGDGASEKVGEFLGNWQVQKGNVLVVADREVVKLGLIDKVERPLKAAQYNVLRFDNIVGEPTLETAIELASFARERSYVAVVGLGGGSAMDMSKLAAAFAVNAGEIKDYLGITSFKNNPLPLALVPTTAGTGAEATGISMLSVEGRKAIVLSPQLVPLVAVLDPLLTVTLPPKITASTGLDALSHALEGFMSVRANPYTDFQAISTMITVARWLKIAHQDGSNIEARRAMSYAAFAGGLSLNAGAVLGHSVAYTIANKAHLSHGVSCAMALPYAISFNIPSIPERLSIAAAQVLGQPDASPEDLVLWVRDLNSDLGMPPSLKEIGLKKEDLDDMVEECITKYPRPTNPVPITRESLKILYAKMFEGDVKGSIGVF